MSHSTHALSLMFVLAFGLITGGGASAGTPVLFDASHAQTAGNADWVIGGGYSDFADALKGAGFDVEGTSRREAITLAKLRRYAAVVLPEPNRPYSQEEQQALKTFVLSGGGLFAIADHSNSDRNRDGFDSVAIFNQFLPELGLRCEETWINQAPVSGTYSNHPMAEGVGRAGTWGGCSIGLTAPSAEAIISFGGQYKGKAYLAANDIASGGRIVALGDSSPFDDGTGAPGDRLHNNWDEPGMDHPRMAVNAMKWLTTSESLSDWSTLRNARTELRIGNFRLLGRSLGF